MKEAALPLGLQIHVVKARTTDDIDTAFATLAQQKVDALLLANDAFFHGQRRQVTALAARYAMPAVYFWRDFAVDGGLMSYSPNLAQAYRQVGFMPEESSRVRSQPTCQLSSLQSLSS